MNKYWSLDTTLPENHEDDNTLIVNDSSPTAQYALTPPDDGGILVGRDMTSLFSDGPLSQGQLDFCYIRPLCDTEQRTSACPHSYQGIPLISNEAWTTCNVEDISSTPPDVRSILDGRDLCAEECIGNDVNNKVKRLDKPKVKCAPGSNPVKLPLKDDSLTPLSSDEASTVDDPPCPDESYEELLIYYRRCWEKLLQARVTSDAARQVKLDALIVRSIRHLQTVIQSDAARQAKLDALIASLKRMDPTLRAYLDENI